MFESSDSAAIQLSTLIFQAGDIILTRSNHFFVLCTGLSSYFFELKRDDNEQLDYFAILEK